MHLNHPATTLPAPWSMGKLSSMKLVTDAKKVGNCSFKVCLTPDLCFGIFSV